MKCLPAPVIPLQKVLQHPEEIPAVSNGSSSILFPTGDVSGITEYTPINFGLKENSIPRIIGFKLYDDVPPMFPPDYLSRFAMIYDEQDNQGNYLYDMAINYVNDDISGSGVTSVIAPSTWDQTAWNTSPGYTNTALNTVNFVDNNELIHRKLGYGHAKTGLLSSNPLPVELVSFDALCHGSEIEFNWATASELNSELFLIEESRDLSSWSVIAEVPAGGNTNALSHYSKKIRNNSPVITYYRLVQKDMDGKMRYYDPLSISCENQTILISPNPSNGQFQIFLPSSNESEENRSLKITDLNGKTIYTEKIPAETVSLAISLPHLSAGLYRLMINNRQGSEDILFNISH